MIEVTDDVQVGVVWRKKGAHADFPSVGNKMFAIEVHILLLNLSVMILTLDLDPHLGNSNGDGC